MNALDIEREHLSATALRQLMTCPLQFRLKRIDAVSPSHRSPALVLGGLYHGVIANALLLVKEDKEVAKEQLVQWFEDGWSSHMKVKSPPIRWSKKATESQQHELGRALIEAWHDQALPIFMEAEAILAVELPFRVPVFDTNGEVLETPLDGFIDCIYRSTDGQTVVVDHKSASQTFGEAEIEMSLQPTAYRHALRFLGYDENAVFHFHVLSKTKKPKLTITEVPRGEDDFDRLYWTCANAERLIASGVFLATSPGWQCDNCEYRNACRNAHRDILTPDSVSAPAGATSPTVEPASVA
jgi:CRISPR/Cas system-associated exonuclease Cas4 (RecB family)